MQQGGSPTPYDRNLGTKMASKAVEWIGNQLKEHSRPDGSTDCTDPNSIVLLGIVKRQYKFTSIAELREQTNFEYGHNFEMYVCVLYSSVTVCACQRNSGG